jgi:nucleotide-binding universal stress UspA family protein
MRETISRILVPVDFSPHSGRAFRYAAMLAQRLGATLELLHVVEDPFLTGAWSAEVYVPNIPALMTTLIAEADQQLTRLKAEAAAMGVAADCAVITGGPPHAIVDRARTGGFDVIVMGTRGRTGLAHVVMGSVAERVLRNAPCPVVTVKAGGAAEAGVAPAAA